jgi:hypothetical protein
MRLNRIKNKGFPQIYDDPVRPELTMDFRMMYGREIYALVDDDESVAGVICVGYTNSIPRTLEDLTKFRSYTGNHAVFYTVWSYRKGAGRQIVLETKTRIQDEKPYVKTFVTLSPKTEMAYAFHTSNGASRIAENAETDNYYYAA